MSALLASVALGLGVTACGSANKGTSSAGGVSSPTTSTGGASSPTTSAGGVSSPTTSAGGMVHIITTSAIPPGQAIRGDGDTDNPADTDGNGDFDPGQDKDSDGPTLESYRFPDRDDKPTFAYGHPANAAEERAITSLVRRYYAAAAASEGASACAMLLPSLARAVPESYGHGSAGPEYLQTGRTCQAVVSLLFEHFHQQLAEAIQVVNVRTNGRNHAQVVIGSRTMPASEIYLERQGSSWKVEQLLGQTLP
ncbi:MAG TPA: hypothetical protein VFV03_00920 [Solirubrobacteraceae bacterium]|nr:hypothetical protein [Solirubrobacteraceae bacterium]